ncbi:MULTISPECIES: hypothetical protein [unclassified Microbacterium]|uniref:hypothetical protein n=1 Tax=unclassified Microbacterium TaxID=2609290 RepID=UPI0016043D6F|nr:MULTISPECIES: hypothetical protein [unclassified Microbacterium]MBT2486639.1 hypothetical protein [Microbacterium sp. ISL-108]
MNTGSAVLEHEEVAVDEFSFDFDVASMTEDDLRPQASTGITLPTIFCGVTRPSCA